jgi:hypothetical protein
MSEQISVRRTGGEFRVLLPLPGGRAVEWLLRPVHPATGVYGLWSAIGVAGSVITPLIEDGSTLEYAFQVGLSADPYQSGTTYDFVGGGHASELLQAMSVTLDDKPITGGGTGNELVVSQLIKTLMPRGAMAGQVIGATHLRHRFTADGVQVEHSHAITMPGVSYRTTYSAMLPGHKLTANMARCDNGPAIPLKLDSTIPASGLMGKVYSLWHSDPAVNPYRLSVSLEAPELGGAVPSSGAWLYDRPNYPKWYINWVGDIKTPAVYSIHRQTYAVDVI